ncbi:hypothetical protein SLS54_007298 [Diplodia seriata]
MPSLRGCSDEIISQGSPIASSNGASEKIDTLTGLIAEDLAVEDGRYSELDIDSRFVSLARHHERKDSNGLFGCRTVQKVANDTLRHDSWCCFKIKQVQRGEPVGKTAPGLVYEWEQPSVNISWNARDHVTLMLCMDTPDELKKAIQHAWNSGVIDASDPYKWHCFIVDKITDLYNRSVWALRDFVRLDVEKVWMPWPGLMDD